MWITLDSWILESGSSLLLQVTCKDIVPDVDNCYSNLAIFFVTVIFAGLDGDQIVNSPEKLAVVEKFANEENIQKVMKEREERKKKKKKEEKTMKAFSPPPPPPPAPPVASRYYFSIFQK